MIVPITRASQFGWLKKPAGTIRASIETVSAFGAMSALGESAASLGSRE
jgi:hypothetical protein